MKYRAVILGAGRIGSSFDGPKSREILTHAHALQKHPKIELLGFIDSDPARAEAEAKRWSVTYFSSMAALPHVDIVIIATPDDTHVAFLEEAQRLEPKVIVCEKPIALNEKDVAKVRQLPRHIPVVVNYSRRFDTSVQQLRHDIRSGLWGNVISASALYTGGLIHNGSHAIDLARYLFGETKGGAFELCPSFTLMEGSAAHYSVFEFDILLEKRRVRFVDEGRTMLLQDVVGDPLYPGYRSLGKVRSIKTGLQSALPGLYDHCVELIEKKVGSLCDTADAIKTFEATALFAGTRKER